VADPKQSYALLSYYEKLYKVAHKRAPNINRYRDKWGMADVLESYGIDEAKVLIEYYFKTKSDHTLQFFFKNYDIIYDMMQRRAEDERKRAELREETRKRMEGYEQSRTSGN
jgi:hypothetical protein